MTPNLSQQAKRVMSPIDGPVHRSSAGYVLRLGYNIEVPPKHDFLSVGDEEVFH